MLRRIACQDCPSDSKSLADRGWWAATVRADLPLVRFAALAVVCTKATMSINARYVRIYEGHNAGLNGQVARPISLISITGLVTRQSWLVLSNLRELRIVRWKTDLV